MMACVGQKGMQYIILENEFDYTEATFADVLGFDNVWYYRYPLNIDSPLLKRLYVLQGSEKANSLITLPGQRLWNGLLYDGRKIDPQRPVCFIYSFRRVDRIRRSGFIDWASKRYPECYHVAYWDDLVKPNHMQALEYAKTCFDLVFSYDEAEAQRYDIRYYPSFYSKTLDTPITEPIWDVFFVGNAKDRLEAIYGAYESLASSGVKCKFVINGVTDKSKQSYDDIEYNHPMTYFEVLQSVLRANCILEIVQGSSTGQTLRVNEAVVYSRRLISNNPSIVHLPQYDSRYMRVFTASLSKDDIEFVKARDSVQYKYPLTSLSPTKFIETIEVLLDGEGL